MSHQYRLGDLANRLGVKLVGDPDCVINSLAPLNKAQAGQLSFLCDARHKKSLVNTQASAVILASEHVENCPTHALVADNPRACYAELAALFAAIPMPSLGVHPSAIIGEKCHIPDSVRIDARCVLADSVVLGEGVILGAGCVLGEGVTIGDNTRLWPGVTLYYGVRIGERVIIHSGAVLGSDGFGMVLNDQGRWLKVPQLGSVIIGDDVEIGANTTIDRGTLEDTVIERGVKLDNQIQIAHNVRIGENTVIAACTGIAGSTTIGANCMISGAVGISDHLTIVDRVVLVGMSTVAHNVLEPGIYASHLALQPHKEWRKNNVRLRQLDKMAKQLNKLKNTIKIND